MRLIDADALMETLEKLQRNADKCIPVERGIWMGFSYALTEIKGSPTVDAVPVVRCVDCKFGEKGKIFDSDCIWCGPDHNQAKPMRFYCASGERKTE